MNEQKAPHGIEWTRIVAPDGTARRGFTWNPISGCPHGCAWTMPDGAQAVCYAKTTAERPALQQYYPHGFEAVTFHPERLEEPLRRRAPAGIFLDSMSDLMATPVTDAQIRQVLSVCLMAQWHTFFLLTKNAPRLQKFVFPRNVWVGASSPPDVMHGQALSRSQQRHMLSNALRHLEEVNVPVRWMSFEPLSWDCADLVEAAPGVLQWAVIGAASDGRRLYPPAPEVVAHLLDVLDHQGVPVFFKGNMQVLPQAKAAWRQAFPRQ